MLINAKRFYNDKKISLAFTEEKKKKKKKRQNVLMKSDIYILTRFYGYRNVNMTNTQQKEI